MFFPLSQQSLAGWCRRVGLSLTAGLDIVRVLQREARSRSDKGQSSTFSLVGSVTGGTVWEEVAESVAHGNSLHEALVQQEGVFNELFVSMVDVGEKSGHLGETLLELADYYDQLIELRRNFLRSLMLPIFELCIALTVVGIMILVLGILQEQLGGADILGLGLIGVSGLVKYVTFLAVLGVSGFVAYMFMKNNAMQFKILHYVVDYIPKIGPVFRTLALARLTWALNLTMSTGMSVHEALNLSFSAAAYGPITDKLSTVLREIDAGGSLFEGFLAAHTFDETMLMFMQSGDESGNVPEAMARLSREYFQQCIYRLKTLSIVGFFLIFSLVAGIIIFFIFKIFSFYVGMINAAGQI